MFVKVIFLVLLASIKVRSQSEACNCVEENTVSCEDGNCVCKLGFFGSDCGIGSAPFLVTIPGKSEFTAGENVSFYCSYKSPGSVSMYYFMLNGVTVSSSKYAQVKKSNLVPQDSGNYTCQCRIDYDLTPKSNVVSLTVVEACNCVEENTVSCEDGTCVCKLGFSGSDCGTGSEPDYYFYTGTNENFEGTRKLCRSKGQIMAMPKTAAEYENLKAFLDGKTNGSVWIGLKRSSGRTFEYANGEELVFTNWRRLQPNNAKLMEACVRIHGANGLWWDDQCPTPYTYVCQFEGPDNKVSYEAYTDEVSYYDAGVSCREKGGDLAMPKSNVENDKIQTAYNDKFDVPYRYWIGIQRELVNWRWLDGDLQTFSFNAWLDNEPNNVKGGEYCAMYDKELDGWKDSRCIKTALPVQVCQSRDGICIDKKPRACYFKIHGLSEDERREYCKKSWPKDRCQKSCGLCV